MRVQKLKNLVFFFFFFFFQKGTKTDLETGRTFATMFSDPDFRNQLLLCHTEEEFKIVLEEHTRAMVERMSHVDEKVPSFDSDNVSPLF